MNTEDITSSIGKGSYAPHDQGNSPPASTINKDIISYKKEKTVLML